MDAAEEVVVRADTRYRCRRVGLVREKKRGRKFGVLGTALNWA